MHFITNGYKRFSKTNSTDPRQRVPLNHSHNFNIDLYSGHALTDSPVGLAAYIIEKFSVWTNYDWIDLDDGGLDGYWSKDDLLNNVMIYWVSGCITSSLRLYKETISKSFELAK